MFKLTHSLLLVMVCLLFSIPGAATHIVGGDITYKYLNDTTYEVKLILYVDCVNGQPEAIAQDSVAVIGVFDYQNQLITTFEMRHTGPVRISDTKYICVKPPSNACVDRYEYVKKVHLPPSTEDRTLTFQRCCRNKTIVNIVDAEHTGATYWVKIPGSSKTTPNTSAVFKELPPNFLCANELLEFDHSATDADGDHLVYGFYEPYIGADQFQPRPVPPHTPPYTPVAWQAPYSANNPMGAASVLKIDSITGKLRMVPTKIGQFVIGIYVKEYREGVLVGQTRRDYQFNILPCKIQVIADFNTPELYCTKELLLYNNSLGDSAKYFWDFGVPELMTDTSSEFEPKFVYPHSGDFTITLVAKVGQCTDTFRRKVLIRDPGEHLPARPDTTICYGDSINLGGIGHSKYYIYLWQPDYNLSSPTAANPTAWPTEKTTYTVVKNYQNCSFTDEVTIDVIRPLTNYTHEIFKECEQVKVIFRKASNNTDSVRWFLNGRLYASGDETIYFFPYGSMAAGWVEFWTGNCSEVKEIKIGMPGFEDRGFYIPNVITANGDGMNDCFEVEYRNMPIKCPPRELVIYNRWGERVYDYADIGEFCWDGNDRKTGRPLPAGTYYYFLKVLEGEYQGTVTLLR